MSIRSWLGDIRERLRPVAYVDWVDIPDEPCCPYRARIAEPARNESDEPEVLEYDVVRGTSKVIYEIHCQCGRRWFKPRLEHVQSCPRCGRAVLVMAPEPADS